MTILPLPEDTISTTQSREMWWEELQGFFLHKLGEGDSPGQVVFRNKSPCEMATSVSWFEVVCSCPEMELGKTPSSSVAPFLSAELAVMGMIRQDQTGDKLDGGLVFFNFCHCQVT